MQVHSQSKVTFEGLYIDDTIKCLLRGLLFKVNIPLNDKLVVNSGIISQSNVSDAHTTTPPHCLFDQLG